ncbi:MAG: hydroxymethylbilane synthase [Candidatus Sumerlaeaceae bacterium]|nr:hydroxymethylbilane synthase [Candidatus Sumerlaeaceae bacterium]
MSNVNSSPTIRLATRGSALALAQASVVARAIQAAQPGIAVEYLIVRTTADKNPSVSVRQLGDKAVFVKEIEDAILSGAADAGVHSVKDLPGTLPPGLELAAIVQRDDPHDALVTTGPASLGELPRNPRIATASLRRAGQIRRLRPDAQIQAIRGNVDTRLRKLRSGEFDALIVAVAGLRRLGISDPSTPWLALESLIPAPGQGALGVEAPADSPFSGIWQTINLPTERECIRAEREFTRAIGADCHTPVGCHCSIASNGSLEIRAMICSADGSEYLETMKTGAADAPLIVAQQAAADLLSRGAAKILEAARKS